MSDRHLCKQLPALCPLAPPFCRVFGVPSVSSVIRVRVCPLTLTFMTLSFGSSENSSFCPSNFLMC